MLDLMTERCKKGFSGSLFADCSNTGKSVVYSWLSICMSPTLNSKVISFVACTISKYILEAEKYVICIKVEKEIYCNE